MDSSSAFYGRLVPQIADTEHVAATCAALDAPKDGGNPSPTRPRSLRHAIVSESRFYRVVRESKLYTIDFGTTDMGVDRDVERRDVRRRASSLTESDYKVVRIQPVAKRATASARSRQGDMMTQGARRPGYSVVKMPEEIVASRGRLQCLVGVEHTPTWFIALAHVENTFMIVSTMSAATEKLAPPVADPVVLLEGLPETEQARVTTGRFYYRVLVPIEVRQAPDLLAPVLARQRVKNAEEILECHETYRCPQSSVTFVKLAYEDGWLFETLTSGIKVLEPLSTEPAIEDGHFFYVVKIPVGIRVAPHIMAQRSGKGFKLHSIVEASQRFTPPGSKITYVRVCTDRRHGGCTVHATSMAPSVPDASALVSCPGGWLFETTMDGQMVLEPMARPQVRHVERLFYRVLEDVDVVTSPTTSGTCFSGRKRLQGTVVECSERLVPSTSDVIGFVKLRHDVGWICERNVTGDNSPPYKLVLEHVPGRAVTRTVSTLYRVLVPVSVRAAPDFECPRVPGVPPLVPGTIIETQLEYEPPGSGVTYLKLGHGPGWLFTVTPRGDHVLEAVEDTCTQRRGTFYFRVVTGSKDVVRSPARTAPVIASLPRHAIVRANVEYTLPRTHEKYVKLEKEQGWMALDPVEDEGDCRLQASCKQGPPRPPCRTLVRLSETMYTLYTSPPHWVSLGYPQRTWFRVPDEKCRTIVADETMVQVALCQARNILAASSQVREGVPLSRKGTLCLNDGKTRWSVTLEEMKHGASAVLWTFPWKQVWWIFTVEGTEDRHAVEVQHGLKGGFRSVLFDGDVVVQNRSVTDMVWDRGSVSAFTWKKHTFQVVIALEGAFFSPYLQYYSYTLVVDGENIIPLDE